MNDGIIYTFGDIDTLVLILDGIALLFDSGNSNFFVSNGGLGLGVAAVLAMMVSLIGTMGQYSTEQRTQYQGPLIGLLMYAVIAIPSIDRMYVSDINTGKTLPVYNVPIGLAAIGYSMSTIGFKVSEAFEAVFQTTSINGTPFESTMTAGNGFLSPVKLMYALRESALPALPDHIAYNVFSYTKYCLERAAREDEADNVPGPNFTYEGLTLSPTPSSYLLQPDFIQPYHANRLAEFKDPVSGGEILLECENIRSVLAADGSTPGSLLHYTQTSTAFAARAASSLFKNDSALQSCADGGNCYNNANSIDSMEQILSQLTGGIAQSRDFLQTRIIHDLAPLIKNADVISTATAATAVANINESVMLTQLTESIEGSTFVNFMIPAINYIIFLFYAMFPLAMLIMITKGMQATKYLAGYLMIGVWGYSVMPIATAINYITIANTREAIDSLLGANSASIAGYNDMLITAGNYLSVGSNMLANSFVIALAIISGSVFALTSVATSAAAPTSGASTVARRQSPAMLDNNTLLTGGGGSYSMNQNDPNNPFAIQAKSSVAAAEKSTVTTSVSESNLRSIAQTDVAKTSQEATNSISSLIQDMFQSGSQFQVGTSIGGGKTVTAESKQLAAKAMTDNSQLTSNWSAEEREATERVLSVMGSANAGIYGAANIGGVLSSIKSSFDSALGDAPGSSNRTSDGTVAGNDGTQKRNSGRGPFTLEGFLTGLVAGSAGLSSTSQSIESSSTGGENSTSGTKTDQTSETDAVQTSQGQHNETTQQKTNNVSNSAIEASQDALEYSSAVERANTYAQADAIVSGLSQGQNLSVNDLYTGDKGSYMNSTDVANDFKQRVDDALSHLGLSSETMNSIKDMFAENAQAERTMRSPLSDDILGHYLGSYHAFDTTASALEKEAAKNPQAYEGKAKDIAAALEHQDLKMYSSFIGEDKMAKFEGSKAKIDSDGKTLEQQGNAMEKQANAATAAATNLTGASAPDSQASSVGSFIEQVNTNSPNGLAASVLNSAFDSGKLDSVSQVNFGKDFSSLNAEQQDKVLAQQMSTAVNDYNAKVGSNGQQLLDFDSSFNVPTGLHGSHANNRSAVDHGLAEFNKSDVQLDGSSGSPNGTVNALAASTKGEISNKDTDLEQTKNKIEQSNTSKTGGSFNSASAGILAGAANGVNDGIEAKNTGRVASPGIDFHQEDWNAALEDVITSSAMSPVAAKAALEDYTIQKGSGVRPEQMLARMVDNNEFNNIGKAQAGKQEIASQINRTLSDFKDGMEKKEIDGGAMYDLVAGDESLMATVSSSGRSAGNVAIQETLSNKHNAIPMSNYEAKKDTFEDFTKALSDRGVTAPNFSGQGPGRQDKMDALVESAQSSGLKNEEIVDIYLKAYDTNIGEKKG